MMNILIAIAAGCASALMFASVITGALFSLVLVYLAPLPLMVAALGWGPASAMLGGIGAGVIIGPGLGFMRGPSFGVMISAPPRWLGHLSLPAQPVNASPSPNGHDAALEWYPIGRIVLWAACIAGLLLAFALLTAGSSGDDVTAKLREP